jgi:5-oxoprolinase (ATP-hydrolysing)
MAGRGVARFARLAATAQSVNVRERLNFSCALFDPEGNLLANAPPIPVHLGSMGTAVREIVRRRAGRMRPGDAYAVNASYHGGTHLPDITVITPVFGEAGTPNAGRVLFHSPPAGTARRSGA